MKPESIPFRTSFDGVPLSHHSGSFMVAGGWHRITIVPTEAELSYVILETREDDGVKTPLHITYDLGQFMLWCHGETYRELRANKNQLDLGL